MSVSLRSAGVRAVLLDIEGTTTPVDFVYQVLFPYVRERVRAALELELESDPDMAAAVGGLATEWAADAAAGESPPAWRDQTDRERLDSTVAYIHWLMDRDRKSRWLKALQGRIWVHGYRDGTLRGQVFPDVGHAFERWTAAGLGIGIYSSGSVLAQQLLFAHSTAGDLTPLLRWHFDTAVGGKKEAASYERIANAIGEPPRRVLFISDVTAELDAARTAGLQTRLALRPPAELPAGTPHAVVHTFDDIAV